MKKRTIKALEVFFFQFLPGVACIVMVTLTIQDCHKRDDCTASGGYTIQSPSYSDYICVDRKELEKLKPIDLSEKK